MSLFKILRFFVPGAQGHFRIFFAAVGVTFCLGTFRPLFLLWACIFPSQAREFFTYVPTLNSIVLVSLPLAGKRYRPNFDEQNDKTVCR